MTSIADQIRSAVNQRDALIIIGEALDRLQNQPGPLPAAPADTWSQWDDHKAHLEIQRKFAEPVTHRSEQATTIREQLAAAHDPDDVRALQAALRLAEDKGQALPPSVPDGQRTGITSDGATGDVDIPPPTQGRFDDRYAWAWDHRLHEFLPQFNSVEAATAFAKGGARWLYYGNRDAVLAMPADWRQWLVRDIGVESEAEAQEVSRDIFKSSEGIARPSA